MTRLLLASASPARLTTLVAAGIDPLVRVSHVDEDAVVADARARFGELDAADLVLVLAQAKAHDVAARLADEESLGADDLLVLGCDSMLDVDGEVLGKPGTAEVAIERWRAVRGRTAVLRTGHWLVDERASEHGGTGGTLGASSEAVIHFADLSDAEIEDYVATGEPLTVAGGFTLDGLGGPFITGIEGDHHGVVGVSLPLLRELLGQVGVSVADLWAPRG